MVDARLPQYSEGWAARSKQCIESTKGACIYCFRSNRQMVAHHMLNQRLGQDLQGHKGITGWELVPVCRNCHMKHCHNGVNWIDSNDRKWSRNTFKFRWMSRARWLLLSAIKTTKTESLTYARVKLKGMRK